MYDRIIVPIEEGDGGERWGGARLTQAGRAVAWRAGMVLAPVWR